MILPQVILPQLKNQCLDTTGLDSRQHCLNKNHFESFAYPVTYHYNSRGFRDLEWPANQQDLINSVWCIGDSFTAGVGSPFEHTWPWVLQHELQTRTINISMDGASNNWIARQASVILETLQPRVMIIHWSYLHRREGLINLAQKITHMFLLHYENIRDPSWPNITQIEQFSTLPVNIQHELLNQSEVPWRQHINDDQLRLWNIKSDLEQDLINTQKCMEMVENYCDYTKLIHSFIPGSTKGYKPDFDHFIKPKHAMIDEFLPLDLARDGHHYDIKTSRYFVSQIVQILNR